MGYNTITIPLQYWKSTNGIKRVTSCKHSYTSI